MHFSDKFKRSNFIVNLAALRRILKFLIGWKEVVTDTRSEKVISNLKMAKKEAKP